MVADSGSTRAVRTAGRINAPRPALVEANPVGVPVCVNREAVSLVREEWRVVDRWWTEDPLDRRYFDLVLSRARTRACSGTRSRVVGFPSAPRRVWRSIG